MALIKCKECGHEVSDKASSCPNCGCPIEKVLVCRECGQQIPDGVDTCSNCGCPIERVKTANQEVVDEPKKNKAWIWALAAALLCLIGSGGYYFYSHSGDKAKLNLTKTDYSKETPNLDEVKGNWDYKDSTDPMTDKVSHLAVCVSNEKQSICGTMTELFLGLHYTDGHTHVMLGVKGGVLRQDRLPMAHVRFDKGEVEMWSVIADGATTHHIVLSNDFINRLRESKICVIKVEAQDGGTGTYTFNTEGLKWYY